MSILRPFQLARAALGVPDDADATAVKRAYRKLTLAHPPDTDPEGFRRVRDAYELLTRPFERAHEMLLDPRPAIDPPPLPPPPGPAPPGELALAILRDAVAHIDVAALLATNASPAATGAAAAPAAPSAHGAHERKPSS